MPPTRTIRTRAEIAEANRALITRRRQRLHNLQNNPLSEDDPTVPRPSPSKYFHSNLENIFNDIISIFFINYTAIEAK